MPTSVLIMQVIVKQLPDQDHRSVYKYSRFTTCQLCSSDVNTKRYQVTSCLTNYSQLSKLLHLNIQSHRSMSVSKQTSIYMPRNLKWEVTVSNCLASYTAYSSLYAYSTLAFFNLYFPYCMHYYQPSCGVHPTVH